MQRVAAAGFTIAYARTGQGSPLLLHGGASDAGEWRAAAAILSADHDVVAWDAPGCGGSSDPPGRFSLPGFADVLAAFMTAVGVADAHVAGLSFGGGLAIQLADRHPRRVRSLVVHGSEDDRAPRPVAEALRDGIPGARMVVLEGAGHVCTIDAPDRLAAEMRGFLSTVRSSPGGRPDGPLACGAPSIDRSDPVTPPAPPSPPTPPPSPSAPSPWPDPTYEGWSGL